MKQSYILGILFCVTVTVYGQQHPPVSQPGVNPTVPRPISMATDTVPVSATVQKQTGLQNQIVCRIIDQETKKPVSNASVFVRDGSIKTTSNSLGYFQITADTTEYLIIEKQFYESAALKVPFGKGVHIQIAKRTHSGYEGGLEHFVSSLKRNVRYPQIARRNATQGRFYISFTIDSLGQMKNIEAISDIGDGCASEVSECLKKSAAQWLPAENTTIFILPVVFQLGDSKIKDDKIELPEGVMLPELSIRAYGIGR